MADIDYSDKLMILEQFEMELNALIDVDDWAKIDTVYWEKKEELITESLERRQRLLWVEIISLLAPYELARNRLSRMIDMLDIEKSAYLTVAEIAAQISGDETIVENLRAAAASSSQRAIFAQPIKGKGGISIKLNNLRVNLGESTEAAANIILAIEVLTGSSLWIFQAGAVLSIICNLTRSFAVKITAQEASVLWGLSLVGGGSRAGTRNAITRYTNQERQQIGLSPLTEEQITEALSKLVTIKSLRQISENPDVWEMTEEYFAW